MHPIFHVRGNFVTVFTQTRAIHLTQVTPELLAAMKDARAEAIMLGYLNEYGQDLSDLFTGRTGKTPTLEGAVPVYAAADIAHRLAAAGLR